MNTNDYIRFFDNYIVVDCIVRKKHLIYFVLEENLENRLTEDDTRPPIVRIVIYYPLHEEGDKWGSKGFEGVKRMKAGVSFTPEERFVGVDTWGQVFVIGGGSSGFEDHLHTREGVSLSATACIDVMCQHFSGQFSKYFFGCFK